MNFSACIAVVMEIKKKERQLQIRKMTIIIKKKRFVLYPNSMIVTLNGN